MGPLTVKIASTCRTLKATAWRRLCPTQRSGPSRTREKLKRLSLDAPKLFLFLRQVHPLPDSQILLDKQKLDHQSRAYYSYSNTGFEKLFIVLSIRHKKEHVLKTTVILTKKFMFRSFPQICDRCDLETKSQKASVYHKYQVIFFRFALVSVMLKSDQLKYFSH